MHIPRFSASPITWVASLIFAPATRHVSRPSPGRALDPAIFELRVHIHTYPVASSRYTYIYPFSCRTIYCLDIFHNFPPLISPHRSFVAARVIIHALSFCGSRIPGQFRSFSRLPVPRTIAAGCEPGQIVRRLRDTRYAIRDTRVINACLANLDHRATNSSDASRSVTHDSICILTGINRAERLIEIPGNPPDNTAALSWTISRVTGRVVSIAQFDYDRVHSPRPISLREPVTRDNPGISPPLCELYLERCFTGINPRYHSISPRPPEPSGINKFIAVRAISPALLSRLDRAGKAAFKKYIRPGKDIRVFLSCGSCSGHFFPGLSYYH